MDRLSAVAIALPLALCACDDGPKAPAQPAQPEGRVNAVMAANKKVGFADLCDIAPEPPKTFSWPALAGSPPSAAGHPRWLNVWATWCKPCIEELPLLAQTTAQWKKQGHAVELTLLSVDADAAAAKSFIAARAGLPESLQLKEAGGASDWLSSVGLASGAAIPVHMVLDAQDRLLCARSGGISAQDLERFGRALFP
jgi:thiol-disulfide isomerase/thioredoxin